MSNLYAKYESDVDKERNGVTLAFEGATFVLRRAGGHNRAYRYALALAAQSRRKELQTETGAAAFNVQEEILQAAFSECVIVSWENVDDRNGDPMECTASNFLDLVRSCPRVWDAIKEVAVDDERFKVAAEDGELLGKPSSGSLSGAGDSQTCNVLPPQESA